MEYDTQLSNHTTALEKDTVFTAFYSTQITQVNEFNNDKVVEIVIKQQPKLMYEAGNKLDLSELIVTLTDSNGIKQDVAFSSFVEYKLTTDYTNGRELVLEDNGKAIAITHTLSGKSVNTNPLQVTMKLTPQTQADIYEPKGKDQTVEVGQKPKAEDSISNKEELPEGTKYEWKKTPDTTKPGSEKSTVVVTYPDGSKDEVEVTINTIKTSRKVKNPSTGDAGILIPMILMGLAGTTLVIMKKKKELN